jgi:hypothetical protein
MRPGSPETYPVGYTRSVAIQRITNIQGQCWNICHAAERVQRVLLHPFGGVNTR